PGIPGPPHRPHQPGAFEPDQHRIDRAALDLAHPGLLQGLRQLVAVGFAGLVEQREEAQVEHPAQPLPAAGGVLRLGHDEIVAVLPRYLGYPPGWSDPRGRPRPAGLNAAWQMVLRHRYAALRAKVGCGGVPPGRAAGLRRLLGHPRPDRRPRRLHTGRLAYAGPLAHAPTD